MATAALQPTAIHQPAPAYTEPAQDSSDASTSTSAPIEVPRGPVTATLNFYSPPADGSSPWNYVEKPTDGSPQRNYTAEAHSVQIHDLRGQEHKFTLDTSAFEPLSNVAPSSPSIDWTSDASIRAHYYPEVTSLLLAALPGSHRIVLFDHTIRRADPAAFREPVLRVHIDQTPRSALARVAQHLPQADVQQLLAGRVRIVNVWRPLGDGPVVSLPLAFAEGCSTRDEDLVGIEHRYPDRTGETAGVRFSEGQRWWYWSGMKGNERLLLKCFDSDPVVGGVGRVPHSAFVDPRTKEGWPPRESIEVRALVFG